MSNNATFILDVKVNADNKIQFAIKQTEQLGKAIKDNNKALKNHSAAQDEAHYKLNQGVTGTSSAARSFSKLTQSIGNGPNGLVGAYATLAANAFAVSAAFNQLRSAAQAAQMLKGLEEQGIRTGRSLTLVAESVRKVAQYSISSVEAMQATSQVTAAGFGAQAVEDLTKAALNSSLALGRNMPDAMDRFIKGVTKLEPELLDEMGIMIKLEESTYNYAASVGKLPSQLTSFEKRQGYLNAVLAEADRKFGGLSDAVEANPYDKLAAAFQDLTKNIMNFVNEIGAIDFATRLASNTDLLSASIFMLIGSVSRQLIPGLYEAADAAHTNAKQIAAMAKEQSNQTEVLEGEATALRNSQLEKIRSLKILKENKEAYVTYAKAVRDGTVEEGQKEKALKSLNAQIRGNETVLKKLRDQEAAGTAIDKQKITDKQKLIQVLTRQRDSVLQLAQAEEMAGIASAEAQAKINTARAKESIATNQSKAATSFATAMDKAASGPLGFVGSLKHMREGLEATRVSMRETTELNGTFAARASAGFSSVKASVNSASTATMAYIATNKLMTPLSLTVDGIRLAWTRLAATIAASGGIINTAKVAVIGLSWSVKVLGTALLNAIPIIGQLMFAWELLAEYGPKIANWFANLIRTEEEKRDAAQRIAEAEAESKAKQLLKESEENLTKVREQALKTAQRYAEANSAAVVDNQTHVSYNTAVANTITQLADSYRDLEAARRGVESPNPEKALTNDLAAMKIAGNIDQQSNEFKTLASMYALGHEALNKRIIELMGNVAKSPKALQAMGTGLQDLARQFAPSLQNTAELNSNLAEADKVMQQFIKTLTPSTPYDAMVERFDAIALSVNIANTSLKEGLKTAKEYTKDILGPSMRESDTLLSANDRTTFAEYKAQQSYALELQERINAAKAKGSGYEVEERIATELLRNIRQDMNVVEDNLAKARAKAMIDYAGQLNNLRAQEVLQGSLRSLEDARYKAASRYFGETKESARAQDAHEEKIRNIEVSRLQSQLAMLDAQKLMVELRRQETLESARLHEQELQYYKYSADMMEANMLASEKQRLATMQRPLSIATKEDIDAQKAIVQSLEERIRSMRTIEESSRRAATIQRETANALAASENTSIELARTALDNQIAAIVADALTDMEKAARDTALDLKVINALYVKIAEQTELQNNLEAERIRLNRNGLVPSLLTELRLKEQQLRADRQSLALQRERETAEARATLAQKEAGLARARTSGNTTNIAAAQAELIVAEATYDVQLNKFRLQEAALIQTAQLTLLESAYINTFKEGLEIQQRSLDIINKRIDATQELNSKLYEGRRIEAEIAAASFGQGQVDESLSRQLELSNAKQTLVLAEQQLNVKIEGINLEYALLEAQRVSTLLELSTQKKILEMKLRSSQGGGLTSDQTVALNQISRTIEELGRYSYGSIRDIAIATAREGVENNRRQVRLLEMQNRARGADTPVNRVLFAVDTLARTQQEQVRSTEVSLTKALNSVSTSIVPDTAAALAEGLQNIETISPSVESIFSQQAEAIVDSKDILDNINNLTEEGVRHLRRLEELSERSSTSTNATTTGATPQEAAANAIRSAIGQGFNVGEWGGPAIPGVGRNTMRHRDPGHAGGWSYDLRAGNRSTSDITAFVIQEASRGAKAIWQGLIYELRNGQVATRTYRPAANAVGTDVMHNRHAHIDYSNAVVTTTREVENLGEAVARTANNITAVAPVTAGPEITVTAPRRNSIIDDMIEASDAAMAGRHVGDKFLSGFAERSTAITGEKADKILPFAVLEDKINTFWQRAATMTQPFMAELKKLGPQGEAVAAVFEGMQSISIAVADFAASVERGGLSISNIAALASAALSTISSVTSAAANAKVAGIDKEIAAEQKRDGKSAESVSKLDALEKKKDAIAKKQFNLNKKLMIAQAVMSTAAAVATTLGQTGFWGIPLAALVGAMGAAQIAIIAGTQYESSYSPKALTMPSSLSIGKRDSSVDLARGPNANAGGEVGYVRGSSGTGNNAYNYRTVGSAYGGDLTRGYGNRGFVVGEKGPEIIDPEIPVSVTPNSDVNQAIPMNATINISALDATGVEEILVGQRGTIIKMLREAANASGQRFMEDVNVSVYTKPNVGRL